MHHGTRWKCNSYKKRIESIKINIKEICIISIHSILLVIFYTKVSCKQQVPYINNNGSVAGISLSRKMPNVEGPKYVEKLSSAIYQWPGYQGIMQIIIATYRIRIWNVISGFCKLCPRKLHIIRNATNWIITYKLSVSNDNNTQCLTTTYHISLIEKTGIHQQWDGSHFSHASQGALDQRLINATTLERCSQILVIPKHICTFSSELWV